MQYARYPFIDIAVHPAVRERFAAGDALAIATPDLESILWANGAAARLFGFASIYEFIEDGLAGQATLRRQIESAMTGIAHNGARDFMMRAASGFQRTTVAARVELVALPGGAPAVVISVRAPVAARGDKARAQQVISGFDGTDTHVAVLDARGEVLAASTSFAEIAIPRSECTRLVQEVAGEADRLVKRMIASGSGRIAAAIGRLTDDPALHLLFAVDPAATEEAEDETPDAAGPAAPERTKPVATPEFDAVRAALAATLAAGAPPSPGFATSEVTLAAGPAGDDAHDDDLWANVPPQTLQPDLPAESRAEEADAIAASAETGASAQASARRATDEPADDDIFGPDDETIVADDEADLAALDGVDAATASHAPVAEDAAAAGAMAGHAEPVIFTFDPHARPVRFVWKIDREGAFSEVSPEFGATLGPNAADIIGRKFGDIAQVFNLDPEHIITDLLSRRDTWSGKTVHWPIQGTDLSAPVDLAALPTYTRDRQFDGFRGFGIIRVGEARKDPEALGLALVPGRPATTEPEAEPEAGPMAAEPFGASTAGDVESPAQRDAHAADHAADTIDDGYEDADWDEPTADFGDDEIADAEDDGDPFRGERPALQIVPTPGRRESDKVIDLGERRARTREGLSPLEQAAFREIGARLTASADDGDEARNLLPANDTPGRPAAEPAAAGDVVGQEAIGAAPDSTEMQGDADDAAEMAGVESFDEVEIAEEGLETPSGGAAVGTDEVAAQGDAVATVDTDDAEIAAEAAEHSAAGAGGVEPGTLNAGETPAAAANAADVTPAAAAMPSAFALPARQALPAGLTEELVDAIPAALLVHAGDTLIHANRDFLSFSGYASLEDLDAAGGLDHLLDHPREEDGAGTMTMRRGDGGELPVTARLRSINWGDGQALLLALSPAVRPAAPAMVQAPAQAVEPAGRANAMDETAVRRLGTLEVEAAELRSILETATDGVVILGADGAIRSMNGSACALFGYDEGEVRGKPFAMLFAHESQRAVVDYLAGLAEHGVSSVLNDGREVIGREANGGFLPLFMTMGRLSGSNGFCAVLRDITQWKRSEEELRNAKRAAEIASSHKSEFLARVSHEIRTPLNAIIGFSEMMVEERFGPIGSPRYLEYAHDIGNSGKHVLDIVNDLLDISKIEAGEVDLEFAAVSLNDQLAECVSMLQPMANGQRVIIRTSLSASVPDVVADMRSIKQIALNLLSNAIRYTPSGGQIVVSTSYEPTGNVVLKIRDTGIGMTRKELEQAMKPFGQVGPGPRQRGDGTGLGLPLTKAMVEANRAQFDIVSTPAEGTLVTITFPPQRVLAD